MIRDVYSSSRRQKKKAMRSRAWLNGVEVTRDCFFADDKAGIVRVFVRDASGHVMLDLVREAAVTQELRGRVRIGRRELGA